MRFQAHGFGEYQPDLAFVQLKATETPALRLDETPGTVRVGRSIGTAGFPMGTTPILLHGKITQLSAMLRRGIISSVFSFASPFPHGFTIDAIVQPGASRSPVFLEDEPVVVGMIESILRDQADLEIVKNNQFLGLLIGFALDDYLDCLARPFDRGGPPRVLQ